MKNFSLLFFLVCFGIISASAQFLSKKKNLQEFNGFYNFHYSEADGEIYLEVDSLNTEFLYVHSLSTGLGSNDIGLDRGQLGDGVIVKFIKSGKKILLIQQNMKYRANTENALEKRSIDQAFAKSVLFGFDIMDTINDNYIIDLTPFLFLDAHGVSKNLKRNKEGTYKLDKTRLALWMENTKAFPKNVEFEALLTFVGDPKGNKLRAVAPDASSVSVIQHHSFVKLPENNYKPRAFDPRCGSYPMSYMDYSTPIWEPITKRFITRHHLEKKTPSLAVSEAVEPIVYYLDPGTPEPVRSALMEGASWWDQAFEAIGYKNAFQVKLLPPDADPMDLRYNVIQWVHRSTRGWSYGSTINDPRTGEIIKGHVSLGSLRIRQDFLLAQALMNRPYAESDDNYQPMLELALARIRQLSAHEVGHTLGFAHNFAASTNDRASVMDYPHPVIGYREGILDYDGAYATGIGEWDKISVAYSYSDVEDNEGASDQLGTILDNAFARGLRYISDRDARAQGGAHAKAHLWDNGESAKDELNDLMIVRKNAINNFSDDNIRKGESYSTLEDVFVPLYFLHRYQTEAVIKLIGGMDYEYGVKGSTFIETKILSKKEQKDALASVLETISIDNLTIPKRQLELFPPRAMGYNRTRESFKSKNGVAFDALGAVATATDMTLELLLHPDRANRLVQQHALDNSNFSFDSLLSSLEIAVFEAHSNDSYQTEVGRTIQHVALQRLLALLANDRTIPQVKAKVNATLDDLRLKLTKTKNDDFSEQLIREIDTYRKHPKEFKINESPPIPDGSPIGSFQCYYN